MPNDESGVLLHNRVEEGVGEWNIEVVTDKYACLPVATIATRIGVVELIYALAANRAIAIVGGVLI